MSESEAAADSASAAASPPPARESARLRLAEVRRMFRLVGEVREFGGDPEKWRPHMVLRLRELLKAEIVVASEIHFRKTSAAGTMKVVDIGWGSDPEGKIWKIHTERDDEKPENYLLALGAPADKIPAAGRGDVTGAAGTGAPGTGGASHGGGAEGAGELVPVKPTQRVHGGRYLILSQYPLPHAGAVDQLGVHRAWNEAAFTPAEHRLIRLFHVELGRLWRRDALRRAREPGTDLPPRLQQTLNELLGGSSEKQIAAKLDLSRHTIHNYVKALHQRFGVCSRGELLARAGKEREKADFTPKLSLKPPGA